MSGNRQQQTHKRELKAGVPMHIDQPCEFVFIDQGADLDFTVGESRLSGRKAGDFARFDRPVQGVRVVSPYDQIVELVLGFGEFSRLIVSGELNVSAFVNTQGIGQAKSLPMELVRTVGVQNIGKVQISAGTDIVGAGALDSGGKTPGNFWFNGDAWTVLNDSLVRLSRAGAGGAPDDTYTIDTTIAGIGWQAASRVRAADIAPDGTIYMLQYRSLFKMGIGERIVQQIALNVAPGGQAQGGFIDGEWFYFIEEASDEIQRLNIVTNQIESFFPTLVTGMYKIGNKLYLHSSGSSTHEVYAWPSMDRLPDENRPAWSTGVSGSPDGRYVATTGAGNNSLVIEHAYDKTVYGEFYAQEGADLSTRQIVEITQPFGYYEVAAGKVIFGGVLTALCGVLNPGLSNPLDFVTAFRFKDGRYVREVSSGTQSFALRRIEDDFPVLVESEVTLTVLPEIFDQ
ncbi:hypothetical protein D8911_14625 (plasmid) [Levilactobacillus brevis]|nr:hypothetical protein D8911_14625 [Levilactobacillus brevis]